MQYNFNPIKYKLCTIEEQLLIIVNYLVQIGSIKEFASNRLNSQYTTLSLILYNFLIKAILQACSLENFECS